ncbi:Gp49 family protein [Methylobacter sp. Wu1]|uniref:Gp49 family protein n=1 Tax=Methylobacter sp. Wu1 TaxID=3119359 RepID=UPI002F924192
MSDNEIEKEIQTKGLTAPRVTSEDIEANIVDTEIVKHVSKSGQILRWAVLTLQNGFAATGKPSVAASPENDVPEKGINIAIANAKEELWPLMGYALKEKLNESK